MNKSYLITANAKINLSLNCYARNEDGYHDLDMIMVPISLCDTILIEEINTQTYLTCSNNDVPTDYRNLVLKAYQLLKDKYQITKNYHFHIEKKIPSQAGLGGGSSDAGAVLKKLIELNNLNLTKEELINLGLSLGSDVPFFMFNQPARCLGRGEKLSFFDLKEKYQAVLIMPKTSVSTPLSYQEFDKILPLEKANNEELILALQTKNYSLIQKNLINNLQPGSIKIAPLVGKVIDYVKSYFPLTMMSGSGASVFALLTNEKEYQQFQKIKEDEKLKKIVDMIELIDF